MPLMYTSNGYLYSMRNIWQPEKKKSKIEVKHTHYSVLLLSEVMPGCYENSILDVASGTLFFRLAK